jgi:glycosyltransferase involved in cell wall biosynthesis
MKNLDGAIALLRGLKGTLSFSIYGPIEDLAYWADCQALMASLPANVSVQYHGSVHPSEVTEVLAAHDLLFLPTRGENFGHVIVEALTVGRPVLISDQTPWRDLEKHGAGWEIALNNPEGFRRALQQCIDMEAQQLAVLCVGAENYARNQIDREEILQKNRHLFNYALGRVCLCRD